MAGDRTTPDHRRAERLEVGEQVPHLVDLRGLRIHDVLRERDGIGGFTQLIG